MNMNYSEITQAYYSCWLGKENIMNRSNQGIEFLYSEERNKIQHGYSAQYDLLILNTDKTIFISYGKAAERKIGILKENIIPDMSSQEICRIIETAYDKTPSSGIKYVYSGSQKKFSKAVLLSRSDYDKYLAFFKAIHPNCQNTDWVKEYFDEMVENKMCCGIIADGQLVCCTEAPGMPYIQETTQKIGINKPANALLRYTGRQNHHRWHGYSFHEAGGSAQNVWYGFTGRLVVWRHDPREHRLQQI